MHSILLFVQKPAIGTPDGDTIWQRFLNSASKITKQDTRISPIAEGVWLIPWKGILPVLAELVQAAKVLASSKEVENFQLSYKALIIDEHSEWTDL